MAAVLFVPVGPSAEAGTLSVNCNTGGDLQAKLDAASNGDTILVKGTCYGNFEISGVGLTLQGNPTATLDGRDLGRTLDINAAGKAEHLTSLTITGGAAGSGAGLATLAASSTLTKVIVTGNLASQTFGNPAAGGIFSTGDMTLISSTVSANRVLATENADAPIGGGIVVSDGDLTVKENSVISGNRATSIPNSGSAIARGGGVYFAGGTLTVLGSTLSGNRVTASATTGAQAFGAGGFVTSGSHAVVTASSVKGNTTTANAGTQALARGGGLYGDDVHLLRSTIDGNQAVATATGNSATNGLASGAGIEAETSLTTTASTISRNSATAKTTSTTFSAGIEGAGARSPVVHLTNSTISLNKARATAPASGGNAGANGGGIFASSGPSSLVNSTVAGNTTTAIAEHASRNGGGVLGSSQMTLNATIIANNTAIFGADCSGGPVSAGHNLIRDTSNCGFTPLGTDKVFVDPKLGALTANGGPTQTMAIALSSPARNAIPTPCAVTKDQRGVSRPQPAGGKCDIGAYELKAT